jgi:hypothetical protein
MTFARWCALAAVVGTGTLAGGCGAGDKTKSTTSTARSTAAPNSSSPATPAPSFGPRSVPTPTPTGRPADPAAVNVIRAWSSALRHGDVRGAARYFAIPSLMANGGGANGLAVITIRSLAEADAANASLPCGAKFISADQRGRYVNALFRLTNRPGPGGGCSTGAGQTARTNFVIKDGRIVEWIRAPDDPRDNSRPAPPSQQPSPTPPRSTPQSTPVI